MTEPRDTPGLEAALQRQYDLCTQGNEDGRSCVFSWQRYQELNPVVAAQFAAQGYAGWPILVVRNADGTCGAYAVEPGDE